MDRETRLAKRRRRVLESKPTTSENLQASSERSQEATLCTQCRRIVALFESWKGNTPQTKEHLPEQSNDWLDGDAPDNLPLPETATLEDWDLEGTNVTLTKTEELHCPSCIAIFGMLSKLGFNAEREHVSFTVYPTKAVRCLRATIRPGIGLYIQPNGVRMFLNKVNQSDLSIDFASRCFHNCLKRHGECCNQPREMQSPKVDIVIYLIDVENDCLVRATLKKSYAALSYVWGAARKSTDAAEASTHTMTEMQEHGFFNLHLAQIPLTVVDAIAFTRRIGLKYLWVDRYCIAQNDRSEKHSQLRAMGAIYDHAEFVIIAAEGEGDGRLRPASSSSMTDSYRRHSPYLSAELGIVYESASEYTLWSTRGWTFQEQMFARRAFVFRGGILTFQCQKSVWQEGTAVPILHDERPVRSDFRRLILHGWPSMPYFRSIMEEYIGRDLTFISDSLDAISGVLSALEASFPSGFLYGLPEVFFDIALLWQAKGRLVDRLDQGHPDSVPSSDLPSWSWARWKGPIDFQAWEAASYCLFLSHYNQNFLIVKKLVDWKKTSKSTGTIVSVANMHGTYRELSQDNTLKLPRAWRRQGLPFGIGKGCELNRLLCSTNDRFTHQSLNDSTSFRFPVATPTEDSSSSTADQPDDWMATIRGTVEAVTLTIEQESACFSDGNLWYAVKSKSQSLSETQVGIVQLMDPTVEDWSKGYINGEFIAISKGEFIGVPGQSVSIPWAFLTPWELDRRAQDKKVYRFYNVMLIQRESGVTTRKGIGRICERLWEQLDRQMIEIELS